MRTLALLGLVLALAATGCSAPLASTPSQRPDRPAPSPSPSGSASEQPAESAVDLLDCDGPVSEMGGLANDFGPDGSGSTADEAFADWADGNFFAAPVSGYRTLGSIGDRALYVYEVDGRTKIVAVFSPRFGEFVNARFTIEEFRTCDPSEWGADVDLGDSIRVWVHADSGAIVTDFAGPNHCGWESARILHLTNPDGSIARQYVRDPLGVFVDIPSLLDTYDEGIELPADATFSGYRTENGLELWFTPDDRAAYVVTPDGVERWPRAEPPIGCA